MSKISGVFTGSRQTVALVVVALIVSAGTAAAVSILTVNPNPISPANGTLSSSADLTVDSQSLVYSGTDVTGVDIGVKNTAGSSHTVDVHVALVDSGGTTVATKTKSSVSVAASSTTTVSVTFASSQSVSTFTTVEITVEETA